MMYIKVNDHQGGAEVFGETDSNPKKWKIADISKNYNGLTI